MAEFFCDNPKCQFHFTIPATMTPADELESLKSFSPLGANPYFPKAKQITKYPNDGSYGLDVKYQATIEGATIGIGIHALLNGVSDIESHHSAIEVDGMTITGRFCSCCMQMFDFMGVAQVEKSQTVDVSPVVINMLDADKEKALQALMKKEGDWVDPPDNGTVHLGVVQALASKMPNLGELPLFYKGIEITPNIAAEAMELLFKAKYAPTKMEQEQAALVTKTPVEGFDGEQLSDPFKSLAKPTILTVDEIFEKKIKQMCPGAVKENGKWWDTPEAEGGSKIKSGTLKALMTEATHEFAMQDFDGKHGNSYEDWAKQNDSETVDPLLMVPGGGVVAKMIGMKDLDILINATGMEDLGALKQQAKQTLIDKIAAKLKPKGGYTGGDWKVDDPKASISTHPEFSASGVEPYHEYSFLDMMHYFTLPSGVTLKVTKEGLDAVLTKLTSHFPNVTFNGKKLSVEDKTWLKEAIFKYKANTKPGQD
ncbi:hypothetical protein CPT_Summit_047 [Stenotrophomonas phage Summit]|nr:hypothetical protein CPT_Summit_047 [Stenotrophomonas phage Summit]